MRKDWSALGLVAALALYQGHIAQWNVRMIPPSWSSLFSWPEGVTTWILLLTLVAIAEQAVATRNAAVAAASQVEIAKRVLTLQFRPKILIRTIRLEETDDSLSIRVVVVNKGGSVAHIREGTVSLDWIWTRSPKSPVATACFAPATLLPGTSSSSTSV